MQITRTQHLNMETDIDDINVALAELLAELRVMKSVMQEVSESAEEISNLIQNHGI